MYFSSTLIRNRDKLDPRAIPGVFWGYPFGKKRCKILNLQINQVFVSENVRFIENNFPFSYSIPMTKLFPACLPQSTEAIFPSRIITQCPNSTSTLTPNQTRSPCSSPVSNRSTGTSAVSPFPSTEVLSSAPGQLLRRSQRDHNPPKYFSDYICDTAFSVISPNPLVCFLHHSSFSGLTQHNQALNSFICQITEPTSYL